MLAVGLRGNRARIVVKGVRRDFCVNNVNKEREYKISDGSYKHHPTYQPGVPRIVPLSPECNAKEGTVSYSFQKSGWYAGMTALAAAGAIATFSPATILTDLGVFVGTTGISILFGHSLGMHRKFIHDSYKCPKWLEYFFVHLGTIMGIAGPIGMVSAHDLRDWAQRQPPGQCHDYYGQQQPFWTDAVWQMHSQFELKHPPKVILEDRIAKDPVYVWMEKYWMAQQIPWAILLFSLGGWSWVVWGVCARVSVSVHGHFFVGWYAHNSGHIQERTYHIDGAAIQGYNVRGWPYLGRKEFPQTLQAIMTAGECFHNNHHAYPGSANLGLGENELDIGYKVLKIFEKLGFVWDIKLPNDLPERKELQKFEHSF